MITGLRGALEAISDDSLTVDIGPMSLEVFAPTSTIASVGPVGGSVRLHTYLYIREEILSLYGFGSLEERDLFVMLIGGVGGGAEARAKRPINHVAARVGGGNRRRGHGLSDAGQRAGGKRPLVG